MAVALRGNLEDFGIADVFQLIGQQRKTGVLELRGEGGEVELRFDRGKVVSAAPVRERVDDALGEMLVRCGALAPERLEELQAASSASAQSLPALAVERGWVDRGELREIEELLTRETFFAILRWRSGAFDFRAQAVPHGRPVESLHGAEQILMDGLRMLDEWQSFAPLVPSEDLVFAPSGDLADWDALSAECGVPRATLESVLDRIDGHTPVRQIIDRSRLGTFDAVRALAGLRRSGLIAVAGRAAEAAVAIAHGASLARSSLRGLVATALPLLLLGAVVCVALAHRLPGDPPRGLAIPRDPWAEARAAHAARGLAHELDAQHFASGTWPDAIDHASAAAWMASPGGAPYYYARRDDGAVLLAPER